jgi:two-component system nitrogen regulation response regulator GlnG
MPEGTILIADDDSAIRTVLNQALSRAGYNVRSTGTAAGLWRWVAAGEGNLVITDVVMPDENGFELMPRIKRMRPDLPIIVMSAQNTILTAITAAERGAFEYLPKPFDLKELTASSARALAQPQNAREVGGTRRRGRGLPLIGRSAGDAGHLPRHRAADADRPDRDDHGRKRHRQGTGRAALHDYGKRKHGNFVAINMAAIPKELVESELFGHEKGAFTGATNRGIGRFEQAEGGTLFLDEIGDMPLEAQTRLLRVLAAGRIHDRRRPHADQDQRAHHRRHQQATCAS